MNLKDTKAIVDNLISISVHIPNNKTSVRPYKMIGMGASNISYLGENVEIFDAACQTIYQINKEIYSTISFKKLEESLIVLIRRLKQEEKKCEEADLTELINKILNIPVVESEALYEIYGLTLDEPSLTLGAYTIYNYQKSRDQLVKTYPFLENGISFLQQNPEYILGVKVSSRDNNKSVEMANKLCDKFENIVNYMISDLTHKNSIGIRNYRSDRYLSVVICNNSTPGSNNKAYHKDLVNISDPFFLNPSNGNEKIWNLTKAKHITKLEKRILISVEWIGRAIHDLEQDKALVQFVFAIEAMLQFNDGSFISPSIVSNISECLAFIISDKLIDRIEISNQFKTIYQKRSAIAHGGDKSIVRDDLVTAHYLAVSMIQCLLTKPQFIAMQSNSDLNDYITNLKFS